MAVRIALPIPGFVLALATSLLLPQAARANIPPEEPDACVGKAKGDACTNRLRPGTCKPAKCSKLDDSKGTPPLSVEYDCLQCDPAPPPDLVMQNPPLAPTPAAAPTPVATPTPAATPASPDPKAAGGCAIAGDGGGMALALLLVFGYRRSRRPADTSLRSPLSRP